MNNLYLIRGASGAGKSTLVEALMNDKPHAIAFSADDYMRKGGEYKYDKRRIGLVHMICIGQVEKHMNPNIKGISDHSISSYGGWQDIFVHNTFTKTSEMKPYYELAAKYNYQVFSIIVENRHEGESVHDVPQDALTSQKETFQVCL